MARQADGRTEQRWRERFRRYERSGLTVAAFCEREGVSTASFYAWRRKLSSDPVAPVVATHSAETPRFVPVAVRSAATGVRIVPPGGAVVELPPDADEHLVRTCIQAAAAQAASAEGCGC